MTNLPQKEQIREAVNAFRQAKGISQKELATMIGVSDATLSQIETRKWEAIGEKMWRRIWNKVKEGNAPGIFKTRDFEACMKACEGAQKHHFMIGLTADTGMGKTTALSAFSLRKNVFYMVFEKSMKPKHFFALLLKEMGIPFEGSLYDMIHKIADELNLLNNPLLIIDEAGKIPHAMILYLHDLRNRIDKNCGIVLGGMPEFKINLIKFANKQKEGYSEFYRRIMLWQTLEGLAPSEIVYICEQNGITDKEFVRDMRTKRKFGDLEKAIKNYQIENSEVAYEQGN